MFYNDCLLFTHQRFTLRTLTYNYTILGAAAKIINNASQHNFERFDPETIDISVYLEQFSAYFETWKKNVATEKKNMLFVSSIGHSLYGLLRDVLAPGSVKVNSFDGIASKLIDHFKFKTNFIVEKYNFIA